MAGRKRKSMAQRYQEYLDKLNKRTRYKVKQPYTFKQFEEAYEGALLDYKGKEAAKFTNVMKQVISNQTFIHTQQEVDQLKIIIDSDPYLNSDKFLQDIIKTSNLQLRYDSTKFDEALKKINEILKSRGLSGTERANYISYNIFGS